MNLKQLRHFIVVADELNFSHAAERLHLSQSALSRQIMDLELSIGTRLFERTSRSVHLTDAGAFLYVNAKRALDDLSRIADECRLIGTGQRGTLNVGVFGSSVLDLIPQVMKSFSALLPEVKISLQTMDKDMQVRALREQRLTVGFNRLVPEEPDIHQEFVRNEPLIVALSERHPLADQSQISLTDIADEPLILYPHGVRDSLILKVLKLFTDKGIAPLLSQEVTDAPTAIALVAGGMGISIAPKAAMHLGIPGVVYRPLTGNPPPAVELVCLYRRGDRNPILASFLKVLRETRDAADAN